MMTKYKTVTAIVLTGVVWIPFIYLWYGRNVATEIPRPAGMVTRARTETRGKTLFQSPLPEGAPRTLFILAYHRTGSTFTASIFEAYPGSFYIFEPLFGMNVGQTIRFFNGTRVHVTEDNTVFLKRDMLTKLLSCDLRNINTGLFYLENRFDFHPLLRLFKTCLVSEGENIQSEIRKYKGIYSENDLKYVEKMSGFKANQNVQFLFLESTMKRNNVSIRGQKKIKQMETKCVLPVEQKCQTSKFRVFKFIRVSMTDLEPLIPKFPGLKVIHLIRDPRGKALSQTAVLGLRNRTKTIAEKYCTRVATNLREAEGIENSFPYRIKTLTYENLSASPFEEARRVFGFLDLPFAPEVEQHLDRVTQNEKGKTNDDCLRGNSAAYCVHKANASDIANQWKRKITKEKLDAIQSVCRDTMDMMWLKPVTFSQLRNHVLGNATLNDGINLIT